MTHPAIRAPFLARLALALGVLGCTFASADEDPPQELRDAVSYSQDIQPVIANHCATCHHGEDPEGGFLLDTYAQVREQAEKGDLLNRIEDTEFPMPQSGLLPKRLRNLFKQWAVGGFVNVGEPRAKPEAEAAEPFVPPTIVPVDVRERGFEFLASMQGHWVGSMNLMGQDFEWFGFDYRAIAPSHIHGLFEGGTIGNLFTSFFVTDFKGKRTIMARNGGLLNGIYRTSYFVLTRVETQESQRRYRFVDAYGGEKVMWLDVSFSENRVELEVYTSRFGIRAPSRHMTFKGKRKHPELAKAAAKAVGFPRNVVDHVLPGGLPPPSWGEENEVTSASYMWEQAGLSLLELAKAAKDPYRIDQLPYVSQLEVAVRRHPPIQGKKLLIYLSRQALTDAAGRFIAQDGYVRTDLLDGVLLFPELAKTQSEFTFTYLHPGKYFLTVIADMDGDGLPSPGDITHKAHPLEIAPASTARVSVDDVQVQN